VIWEAQFGDFVNAAQVIVDNFIVASYEKWQVPNSLVMLLPHGFEGQGPEHSSARLERFLILCAENNMQVCNASTPSQYFHLLRRHIKHKMQIPLIIMTPKSLLRLPQASSAKEEFISGRFHEVLDDSFVSSKNSVTKILLTSGKIYYDLAEFREKNKVENTAIVRIEQFYPFPSKQIKKVFLSYPSLKNIVWVQEEPMNMGAWSFVSQRLLSRIEGDFKLSYAGRVESASPAVGSYHISIRDQKRLLKEAFSI
jgi:2-oxoglutarate dehydrogenase E1 component